MIALSVNLNKIALIRNSRDTTNPDVPEHARMAIDAGADVCKIAIYLDSTERPERREGARIRMC